MNVRSRGWTLTFNNYSQDTLENMLVVGEANKAEYMVLGKEVAPTTGTPHLQGYIYFPNAKSFAKLSKMFKGAHIEKAKADAIANRAYCTKDGDYKEFGKCPHQGERTDLEMMRDLIKDTGKMAEVVSTATSFQSVKMCEIWLKYHEEPRPIGPITVEWFYGPSGTGKTRSAWEILGTKDTYRAMSGSAKWWEGYDGHSNVIIDDFREEWCSWKTLLELTDIYPLRVD